MALVPSFSGSPVALGLMFLLKRTRSTVLVDAIRHLATEKKRFESFDDLHDAIKPLLLEPEDDAVTMVCTPSRSVWPPADRIVPVK